MAVCGLFVISTCVTTLHLCDMIMHLFSANQMHLIFSCTLLASKSQELNIDSTLFMIMLANGKYILLKPLNPRCDQHVISPYMNTSQSFIKMERIKEMITNLRSFDY